MIKKDVDLNSDAWCDLIFEGRNQEYGTYYLRKTSSKRHLFALSILIVVIAIIFPLSKLINFYQTQQIVEYELKPIELSNLFYLEESFNNTRTKAEEKPPLKEITKFAPPTITEDDIEDESFVEEEEVLQDTDFADDSTDTLATLEVNVSRLLQQITELNHKETSETKAVDEKNRDAEFPNGGRTALLRYIYQNIEYPSAAFKQRIHGRVVCSFIINEDGSISDITLVQGVYAFLDDEVLRVIRSMPVWKPAMKDGKAIKNKCIIPVVFRLN